MTQLARSFAATGHATLRGQSIHGLAPLAAYLSAPFWWINDVPTAYSLIKAFDALIMAAAVFPAYGLARLVVGHRWALFAAAGTGLSPALAYAPILVKEPTAYPAATLALFLITRWLARPTRRGAVLAVAACVLGLVAKDQLAVLFPIFAAAGLALVWRGDAHDRVQTRVDARGLGRSGRHWRSVCSSPAARSSPTDPNRGTSPRPSSRVGCSTSASGPPGPRDRARGRAARRGPRIARATEGRGRSTRHLALAFVTIVSVVCFGVYTAVKAAYLSTVFANLTLERNLIFLVPLLFAGTALFFERRGGRWWAVVAAGMLRALPRPHDSVLADAVSRTTRLTVSRSSRSQTGSYGGRPPRSSTPSSPSRSSRPPLVHSFLGFARRGSRRTRHGDDRGLDARLDGDDRGLRRERREPLLAAALLDAPEAGELARPDDAGRVSVFLGQAISDPNPIDLLEFWNRSLTGCGRSTRPRPGPARPRRPTSRTRTGRSTPPHTDFVARHAGRRRRRPTGRRAGRRTTRCSARREAPAPDGPDRGLSRRLDGGVRDLCPVRRPARDTRARSRRPRRDPVVRQGRSQHRADPGGAGRDLAERAADDRQGDGQRTASSTPARPRLSCFRRHQRPGAPR